MKNETQFIQAVLDNDNRVFGQFYDFYFDKMSAMLLQMGAKKDEIEDYFQDGIIKFIQAVREGFRPKDHQRIGGYLRTIIRNHYTKTKGKMSKHPTEEFNAQIHDQTEASIFDKESRIKFVKGITELNPKEMKIVFLRFFCRLNNDEIAMHLGYKNEQAVRQTFYRIMQRLRNSL
jgi:RNA polymerase sigma factor (sigma-70 family)